MNDDPIAASVRALLCSADPETDGVPAPAPDATTAIPDCYFCRGGAASHFDSQGRVRPGHGAASAFHPTRLPEKAVGPDVAPRGVSPRWRVRRGWSIRTVSRCQKGETPHREYPVLLPSASAHAPAEGAQDRQAGPCGVAETFCEGRQDPRRVPRRQEPLGCPDGARAIVERTSPTVRRALRKPARCSCSPGYADGTPGARDDPRSRRGCAAPTAGSWRLMLYR
jgi:hypothetical protein